MPTLNLPRNTSEQNMSSRHGTTSDETLETKYPSINQPKDLLDIPAELRLLIYSFLRCSWIGQTIHTDMSLPETFAPEPETKTLASLSGTCRVIHNEIQEKLYSCLHVSILDYPNYRYASEHCTKATWTRITRLRGPLRHVQNVSISVTLRPNTLPESGIAYLELIKVAVLTFQCAGNLKRFYFALEPWTCDYLDGGHNPITTARFDRNVRQEFDYALDVISRVEGWFRDKAKHWYGEDRWYDHFIGLQISDGADADEQASRKKE